MCSWFRTGSKLGISPLMLAAMNGHTSTVKLLLDMGSDINAQVHVKTIRSILLTVHIMIVLCVTIKCLDLCNFF